MSQLLAHLHEALFDLTSILGKSSTIWKSTDVIYHPPHVQRLQTNWRNDYRLSLHRIWPCPEGEEPLLHNHPWPQAAYIVKGRYLMGIGAGPSKPRPEQVITQLLTPGASYAMDHPLAWHSVNPVGGPSLSVMLTGAPWPNHQVSYDKPPPQPILSPAEHDHLLAEFREHFLNP